MKIAVVGATGLVGRKMLEVLQERNFPAGRVFAVASEKSAGKTVPFGKNHLQIIGNEEAVKLLPDIALFSAGSAVSRKWAPKYAETGTFVIDNSSAWRSEKNIPLIVPEINGDLLTVKDRIIANPNCSTIQMVMALAPLHHAFTVRRIVVSTYQSVTGSGAKGIGQLLGEQQGKKEFTVYPHPIHMNVLPHAGDFTENGYTTEEMKLVNETRKILNDYNIAVSATAVRVPVKGGHSEAVNVTFKKPFTLEEIYSLLRKTPGITVVDAPSENAYPMPLYAEGKDDVFVGRIRKDFSTENGLNLWIVSDNLRKGAATNAVQIAELLIGKGFISKEKQH